MEEIETTKVCTETLKRRDGFICVVSEEKHAGNVCFSCIFHITMWIHVCYELFSFVSGPSHYCLPPKTLLQFFCEGFGLHIFLFAGVF